MVFRDCFAFGSAIPGRMLSNKKPLRGYFCNLHIPPSGKPESVCVNCKKAVFTAFYLSGKRDSNPRPSAWEADALPLSYSRNFKLPSAWDPPAGGLPLSYSRIFKSLTKIMNRFISANKLFNQYMVLSLVFM